MHTTNSRARLRLLGVTGVCAALLLMPGSVRSHTYLGFDWTLDGANERTTLLYSVNPLNASDGLAPAQSWLGIANAMSGVWNAAAIGLTLQPTNQGQANEGAVTAATNIEIRLRDHNAPGGAFLDGIFDPAMAATMCDRAAWPPKAGRVGRVLLCFDPTPLSNQGANPVTTWRNDGATTLDPTAVAVHEVSHAMRMHHANLGPAAPAGAHRTNPIAPGDHGTALTAHDIAEGRASAANRGIGMAQGNVGQAGGAVAVLFPVIDENALPIAGPLSLAFGAGALGGEAAVTLRPLDGAALPFPVNGGASPVFMALHVDIAGAGVQSDQVVVTFSYADAQFTDVEFYGPHGPVDETQLGLFVFTGDTSNFLSGSWTLLNATALSRDPVGNSVSFLVPTAAFSSGSLYLGIAAVPEPSAGLLLGAGVIGLAWRRRRQLTGTVH